MEKSFQSGPGNSEVVSVLGIPFIVGSGGSGGAKKLCMVESDKTILVLSVG